MVLIVCGSSVARVASLPPTPTWVHIVLKVLDVFPLDYCLNLLAAVTGIGIN